MNTSLNRFFSQTDSATLDNCDREQIHLSGQIQNIGGLLLIDPKTNRIVGCSENVGEMLSSSADPVLGEQLCRISEHLAKQVTEAATGSDVLHEVLDFSTTHNGIHYDTVVHQQSGRTIIEFVPNVDPSATNVRKKMRLCSKACTQILHADNFATAMQLAVDAARRISGYSRVKIYRFLTDWSGEVAAESNDGSLPSYLGLHFPERDIPKQARQIMRIVPYRSIGSVFDNNLPIRSLEGSNDSLDLTGSVLRSVSPMHTAYLRNMDVGSSFSSALLSDGELWGMIAMHHKDITSLPFDSWSLMQDIGAALMLRHDQQQRTETADMIAALRRIENGFASELRQRGNIDEVLKNLVPVLQKFLKADGFAFKYGTHVHTSGNTPPEDFIHELIAWTQQNPGSSDQLQTTSLHKEWSRAKAFMDTACGVLIQPIVLHRVCQLIWFRGPIAQTVSWAGNPESKTASTTSESSIPSLTPRTSFETWVNQHHDQSVPWRPAELQVAREIFQEFLDIIAAQHLLKEENSALKQFAHSAAHDLKAPLRQINFALATMREEKFNANEVRKWHEMASRSAGRLDSLTNSLLELSVIKDRQLTLKPLNLKKTIEEALSLLSLQIIESQAEIVIGPLAKVDAEASLMIHLFMNLIGNAIKYRSPERSLRIQIDTASLDEKTLCIAVTDNGLGISPDHAERIFEPLFRLHRQDDIEGTGLGLTICQRIVKAHHGILRLDTSVLEGARFLISLPQNATVEQGVETANWQA